MKILLVSSFLLFKETRFGGSKRLYYLAEALNKRVDLDIICLDLCNEIDSYRKPEDLNIKKVIKSNKPELLKRIFYSPYDGANLEQKTRTDLKKLIKAQNYDSVLLLYPLSLSVIDEIRPFCKNIIFLEDDLIIERYRIILESYRNKLPYFWKYFRYRQIKAFYDSKIKGIKKFICISPEESLIVKKLFPHCETFLLSYGIDIRDFPLIKQRTFKSSIGYIGNFQHLPNVDSVRYFLESLLPLLSGEKIKVIIAGKNIPPEICAEYHNQESLVFLENPDLIDFYSRISVFVNPIISGRGMRTKVIESAAFGIPVISTRLGAEGLDDLRIPIFHDPGSFKKLLMDLLNNDTLWEEISAINRKTITECYTSEKLADRLIDIIKS
ncbi:MAG: glycosyltransferase family 4 protein [Fibrobacter sp.]|nr:glycosyltransferase family 4 protein [Fibrobacter sp.]